MKTGTWLINGSNGQLQRIASGIGLRAGPVSTGALIDAIGYGTLAIGHPFAEGGMSAPALDNGRSIARAPFDGRDSDINAADLVLGAVGGATPRATNVTTP